MTALNEIKETMVATVVDQVALYRDFKIHVIGLVTRFAQFMGVYSLI